MGIPVGKGLMGNSDGWNPSTCIKYTQSCKDDIRWYENRVSTGQLEYSFLFCLDLANLKKRVITSYSQWPVLIVNRQSCNMSKIGYGAFSVSPSQVDAVISYINKQRQHHESISFKEEYEKILKNHNVKFDENYLWT